MKIVAAILSFISFSCALLGGAFLIDAMRKAGLFLEPSNPEQASLNALLGIGWILAAIFLHLFEQPRNFR